MTYNIFRLVYSTSHLWYGYVQQLLNNQPNRTVCILNACFAAIRVVCHKVDDWCLWYYVNLCIQHLRLADWNGLLLVANERLPNIEDIINFAWNFISLYVPSKETYTSSFEESLILLWIEVTDWLANLELSRLSTNLIMVFLLHLGTIEGTAGAVVNVVYLFATVKDIVIFG